MTKRTQIEEIRLLRRALADLYIVHTGRGTIERWGALAHLHCKSAGPTGSMNINLIKSGVVKQVEAVLKETAKKGY